MSMTPTCSDLELLGSRASRDKLAPGGVRMAMAKKDYATAILLNLFVPGAGYMYAGRVFLGIVVMCLAFGPVFFMGPLAFGWAGFFGLIGAVDGYLTVKKHNDAVDAMTAEIAETELKRCPMCAEKIQREAKVCRFCGKEV
jgi:hypothetical protein